MVGEIFQEIWSSLSLAAILVCVVTTVFVLVPCSDDVGRKERSSSVADSAGKQKLYERKHQNIGVTHDLRKGRMTGLSGLEVSSTADDHDKDKLKGANLESFDAAEDDKRVFCGVSEELKGETVRVGGVQDVRVGEVLDECSERPGLLSQVNEQQENLVAETPLRYSGDESGESKAKREEASAVLETDMLGIEKSSYHEEGGVLLDDWEGIERTELEKLFGKAVAFVGSKSSAGLLDSTVRLQLYGLHKIATEGPCHEPRPMALKLFARAKWNAWQRLGNMNRDLAMEQYMILLSKGMPEWEERL